MDAIEDVSTKVVATFPLKGEALKTAREELAHGALTQYLRWAESRLTAQGEQYFCGEELTMADLKMLVWARTLKSGILDHIPTDLTEQVAPKLNEHFHRVSQHPKIIEHFSK